MIAEFSVIVPCYNQASYLSEALTSVQRQVFGGWECIVADDGSTDETASIANQFCLRDRRFRYVRQDHAGVSAARNLGIRRSTGRYLLPLDADDRIGPGYLQAAKEVLDVDRNVTVVYCRAELFGERTGPWHLPEFQWATFLLENCIFCTAAFRRVDFDGAGGYREEMRHGYEDWDFWLSLLRHGGKVHQLPGSHFFYRIRAESRDRSMTAEQFAQMRAAIYAQHRELYLQFYPDPIGGFIELQRLRESLVSPRVTFRLFLNAMWAKVRRRAPVLRVLGRPARFVADRCGWIA